MDGYSGTVVQTYKVESKKKQQKKGKKEATPEKREPPKTLKEVGNNTREDVCCCIKVLTEYIKEAIKLVLCAPDNPKHYEPKFGPMFCEMGDITIRLFGDLYHLLKYLVKTICCLLAATDPPWAEKK